ncbi:hypothetical protein SJR89_01220 [Aeromonas caviae]|uniref:hypothetical protein n=1 Tax=Aeromonas caviae TaxID=648 RepID=UPI0029D84986|nr:hypothetical protein [Aeromonas caviae]MDX7825725.1 hypothetical protein [Aeromonas caviae]
MNKNQYKEFERDMKDMAYPPSDFTNEQVVNYCSDKSFISSLFNDKVMTPTDITKYYDIVEGENSTLSLNDMIFIYITLMDADESNAMFIRVSNCINELRYIRPCNFTLCNVEMKLRELGYTDAIEIRLICHGVKCMFRNDLILYYDN